MLDQIFEIINAVASSTFAAIIISLAMNVALAWGWWRREQGHNLRYDAHRAEWMTRENAFLECLTQRDEEVQEIGREAFSVLQDVAAALAGMERTLDGLEMLVQMSINEKLHGDDKGDRDNEK